MYLKYKGTPTLLKKMAHNFGVSDTVLREMTVLVRDRKMREKKPKKIKPAAAPAAGSGVKWPSCACPNRIPFF